MTDTVPDYGAIAQMRASSSLTGRVVACADILGCPLGWGKQQFGTICADADLAGAWAATYAPNPNVNPDTGARTDVITDQMIHDRVSTVWAADPINPANSTPPGDSSGS